MDSLNDLTLIRVDEPATVSLPLVATATAHTAQNEGESSAEASGRMEDGGQMKDVVLWRKFDGLPPIPGFLTNVVALFQNNFGYVDDGEGRGGYLPADANDSKEKHFASDLCKYLLNNGAESVQIYSNLKEYGKYIAGELEMEKETLGIGPLELKDSGPEKTKIRKNSIDVTVVLLMPCYGRWQEQIMWGLVHEAYGTSRLGVILLGNAAILENPQIFDKNWKDFVEYFKGQSLIERKEYLEIGCRKHGVVNRRISNSEDLRQQSPLGGCVNMCGPMECGHFCGQPCHPSDPDHETDRFRCKMPCKRVCPLGHPCRKVCWEDCGLCMVQISSPRACKHEPQTKMLCHERSLNRCQKPVKKTLECGHQFMTSCYLDITGYKCPQLLQGELACGHSLIFRCSDKIQEPILCQFPMVKIFECGHKIYHTCYEMKDLEEMYQVVCGEPCDKKLKCGHFCGKPCHPDDNPKHENLRCMEPCKKRCKRGIHRCSRPGKHPCWEECGPCESRFTYLLDCGHQIKIICADPDPDLEGYYCREKCMRRHHICRHECRKICGDDCGLCEELVLRTPTSCQRNHTMMARCQEGRPSKCRVLINPARQPECGHRILVNCFEADDITQEDLALICEYPCAAVFDDEKECGHRCRGSCKDCFQGRFHMRCNEPCGKILICSHSCTSPCSMVCPPCRHPCFNSCEHSSCRYECGVPCVRDCQEPCVYKCKHSACSKKCSEVCDKPICSRPCPESLPCGHPCVGFCGEPCPPFCGVCNPEKLLAGTFSGATELHPADRFIFLPDCGHAIESNDMEAWLNVKEDEILPIRCPVCTTRIKWIHRYSKIFNENWKLINAVRQKILGTQEEIEEILMNVEHKILEHLHEIGLRFYCFPQYPKYILDEISLPRRAEPNPEFDFQSMSLDKANFLNWVATEWINCSTTLLDLSKKLTTSRLAALTKHWAVYLVEMMWERVWPLHPNEMLAIMPERERLEDMVTLFSRLDVTQNEKYNRIMGTVEASWLVYRLEDLLSQNKPYCLEIREEFKQGLAELDAITNYTLNITDIERMQIVYAFGEGTGRWFKCANGHVYVVTECGGATEIGTCNECGAPIGGHNHALLDNNYLASEMDGAAAPMYPTALQRN